MKKTTVKNIFAIVCFLFVYSLNSLQAQQPPNPSTVHPDRFLVIFEPTASQADIDAFKISYNCIQVDKSVGPIEAFLMEVKSFPFPTGQKLPNGNPEVLGNIHEVVQSSRKRTKVKGSGEDYLTYIEVHPGTDNLGSSNPPLPPAYSCIDYNVETIVGNLSDGEQTIVGFLDTGIGVDGNGQIINPVDDLTLFNNFIDPAFLGYNYMDGAIPAEPHDDHGHGLHVASVAASLIDSPYNTIKFQFYKTHDADGEGFLSNVIFAIDQGIMEGVKVFNASIGYNAPHPDPLYPTPFQIALDHIDDHDIILVAAAGNDSLSNDQIMFPTYPASFDHPHVISVGAMNCDYELIESSNHGPISVDLAAPGDQIKGAHIHYHTPPGASNPSNLVGRTGTSMAVPYVTAVAAMGMTHVSNPKADDVICAIISSTTFSADLLKVGTSGYINGPGTQAYLDSAYFPCSNEEDDGQDNLQMPEGSVHSVLMSSVEWQVSPNPFDDNLDIQFTLETPQNVSLRLLDVNGSVLQQMQQTLENGKQQLNWNMSSVQQAGVYLLQIQLKDQVLVKKVVRR